MKLHALSISRWKHADASVKEPVHLSFAVDLSQLSFFQRGTVKEITALVLRTCVSKTNPRRLPGVPDEIEHNTTSSRSHCAPSWLAVASLLYERIAYR